MPRGGNRPLFSPVVDGRKTCSRCKVNKPVTEFYRRGDKRGEYQASCRDCVADSAARRKESDPLMDHRRHVWVKYRLRYDKYEAMLAAQGGRCAICCTDDPGMGRRWAIDHDHACCPTEKSCGRCVRGLLCHQCNRLLGDARDSVETLRAAIDYLGGQ